MKLWIVEARVRKPLGEWFVWSYAAHLKRNQGMETAKADRRHFGKKWQFRAAKYVRGDARKGVAG